MTALKIMNWVLVMEEYKLVICSDWTSESKLLYTKYCTITLYITVPFVNMVTLEVNPVLVTANG